MYYAVCSGYGGITWSNGRCTNSKHVGTRCGERVARTKSRDLQYNSLPYLEYLTEPSSIHFSRSFSLTQILHFTFANMVALSKLSGAIVASTLFGASAAHPGEHHDHESIERSVRQRELLAKNTRRSLDGCSQSAEHRALMSRSTVRRANQLDRLRQKRGLGVKPQKYRRDLATLQEFETGKSGQINTVASI